jgi:four helix bundle protein
MKNYKDDLSFQFKDLIIYQKALVFVDYVYELTALFPKKEEFRLTSQFIRAAQSIALNIAEGSGGTKHEFKYFLRIAKRSLRECVVCITIARRQNIIIPEKETECRILLIELSKMLNSLIKSIKPTEENKFDVKEEILLYNPKN